MPVADTMKGTLLDNSAVLLVGALAMEGGIEKGLLKTMRTGRWSEAVLLSVESSGEGRGLGNLSVRKTWLLVILVLSMTQGRT